MLKEAISCLAEKRDLSTPLACGAMEEIIAGAASPAQIGAFLIALRMKGETPGEITAFATVLRAHALPVPVPRMNGPLVDTCGTGGDSSGTFNISTAAAFVAAGAGVPVVKHGNRGVSTRCGSADVLEALGVGIGYPPAEAAGILARAGICFLFAPACHPAMRHAAGARREIGIRTVFNILGPLSNPAEADAQILGVYDPALIRPVAEALRGLSVRHAMVVHGNGLDEISTCGPTNVAEVKGDEIHEYIVTPEEFGIQPARLPDLSGGSPDVNAQIIRAVLAGETGATRDIVLLNAAAAIYVGGRARDIPEGLAAAAESVHSGAALKCLCDLIAATEGYR